MSKELYSNLAVGFLAGATTSSAGTITLVASTMFPSTGNFMVKCDSEIIGVTANASNVLTVTRGQEGTTAAAHLDNAPIFAVLTDGSLRRLHITTANAGTPSFRRQVNFVDGGGVSWTIADDGTNDLTSVSAAVASSSYEAAWTTPPAASTFAWFNQLTGQTLADSAGGGLYLFSPPASGDHLSGVTVSVGSTYTLTVRSIPTVFAGKGPAVGLFIHNSGSGNSIRFGYTNAGLTIDWYNFVNNDTANYGTLPVPVQGANFPWLQVIQDATHRTWNASQDGHNWLQVYQGANTEVLTPDGIGLFIESNDTTVPAAIRVISWTLTSP